MKKIILILFLFNLFFNICFSQELRVVKNTIYGRGEELKFEAYYRSFITGRVTAGIATLEVTKENKILNGRNTYHVVGIGRSKGLFNLFYKVIDRYETYIDELSLAPWMFIRRVNEGDYKIEQDTYLNQNEKTATIYQFKRTKHQPFTKTIKTTQYTQDIISIFYYTRTYDLTNIKLNQEFPVNFILDDSVYVTKIVFTGRENIKTRLGEFKCLKFKPMVLKGNVFSDPYPLSIWITDDNNRIPVLAESEVAVGSVRLELIDYKNLLNPLSSKIK